MTVAVTDRPFRTYAPGFDAVLGDAPRLERLTEVDAHEGDLAFALAQHDGTGEQGIVDVRRLAVLAEAGDVDGRLADDWRDVRRAEAHFAGPLPAIH